MLTAKVAIVTGAGGGGQGRAVARHLASNGAAVVVSDIDEAGGLVTVAQIRVSGGTAIFQRADAGDEEQVRRLIAFAEETFGGLDIMVSNAGPYFPGDRLERWAETMRINLLGSMYATLHAIEPMRRRGGGANRLFWVDVGRWARPQAFGVAGVRRRQGRHHANGDNSCLAERCLRHPRQLHRTGLGRDRRTARVCRRAERRRTPDVGCA